MNLAAEARADIAILIDGRVIASSTPVSLRRALEQVALPLSGTIVLAGDEFVVQRLSSIDSASVYALSSVTAAARIASSETGWLLTLAGAGALLIAAIGSWWLARTVARPIDRLSNSLARMAKARDFDQPLPRTGGSRELDTLTATFNELRTAVSLAEAESEAAYLGVIGALATALDARDPYTAGHSQRVADLSTAIGRQMQLSAADLETLRLGALLHDIGKIGVSDAVLRKPTKLTADEFEQIKLHPTLGARILKPLRFLDAQLPIVELHHERPDGRGYPHGLKGDEIPMFARIVHVADAFDAMTSARAYRGALPVAAAVGELWRLIGVDFDRSGGAGDGRIARCVDRANARAWGRFSSRHGLQWCAGAVSISHQPADRPTCSARVAEGRMNRRTAGVALALLIVASSSVAQTTGSHTRDCPRHGCGCSGLF